MKKNARLKQLKVFAIGLPLLLLLFAWRHYVKFGLDAWVPGCIVLAVFSIFTFIFCKRIFEQFFDGWMKVVGLIGFCMTTLLLTIIYYGVFTPVALVMRFSGKDLMARRLNSQATSYWLKCTQEIRNKESYLQQF